MKVRDLGVMVQSDLKVDQQCCKAANEANRKLGMRGFKNKTRAVMLPLYKGSCTYYITPKMEFLHPPPTLITQL